MRTEVKTFGDKDFFICPATGFMVRRSEVKIVMQGKATVDTGCQPHIVLMDGTEILLSWDTRLAAPLTPPLRYKVKRILRWLLFRIRKRFSRRFDPLYSAIKSN